MTGVCDQRGPNLGESHLKQAKHRVFGRDDQSFLTLPFPKHGHQDYGDCRGYKASHPLPPIPSPTGQSQSQTAHPFPPKNW